MVNRCCFLFAPDGGQGQAVPLPTTAVTQTTQKSCRAWVGTRLTERDETNSGQARASCCQHHAVTLRPPSGPGTAPGSGVGLGRELTLACLSYPHFLLSFLSSSVDSVSSNLPTVTSLYNEKHPQVGNGNIIFSFAMADFGPKNWRTTSLVKTKQNKTLFFKNGIDKHEKHIVPEIWVYSYSLFISLRIYNQVMSIKNTLIKFKALYGYQCYYFLYKLQQQKL